MSTPSSDTSRGPRREAGLAIRDEAIAFLSSDTFVRSLEEVLRGDSLARTVALRSSFDWQAVLQDMRSDPKWAEERWRLDAGGDVEIVSGSRFDALPAAERFSWSDSLRKPAPDAYALRGLLSALHSDTVLRRFSQADGRRLQYRSADIARYRPGHYLRRHDDLYDGRVFGLVFFLHDHWPDGAGTHLVAEKPDGRCAVVEPRPGTVAMMRLAGEHFHQVEPNTSTDWTRYSIAVHFGEERA
ncbi:2OG-Fe(II) oxygenase [Curtobacterium sp. NPDC088465]|uniref:2OG-Fe(II) oxygenase n=2 Tax=Curtobacterium TaxID=2034 RepID=UPI0037F166D2